MQDDYSYWSENLHSAYLFYTLEVDKLNKENKQMREYIGKAEDIARTYQDYRPCLLIKKELQQALNKGGE